MCHSSLTCLCTWFTNRRLRDRRGLLCGSAAVRLLPVRLASGAPQHPSPKHPRCLSRRHPGSEVFCSGSSGAWVPSRPCSRPRPRVGLRLMGLQWPPSPSWGWLTPIRADPTDSTAECPHPPETPSHRTRHLSQPPGADPTEGQQHAGTGLRLCLLPGRRGGSRPWPPGRVGQGWLGPAGVLGEPRGHRAVPLPTQAQLTSCRWCGRGVSHWTASPEPTQLCP